MKMGFSLLMTLIFPCLFFAQDHSLMEKRVYTNKKGGRLHYRILYPVNYSPEENYPLVLFLHGAGERGDDNEKQLTHGVARFLDMDFRKMNPCILIVPQCPQEDYWACAKIDRSVTPFDIEFNYDQEMTESLDLAIELTQQMIRKEAVDRNRVYITGLSMGGMGTLEAIARFPNIWAAGAVVCGGGDLAAFKKRQAKVPLWLFHGDADVVVDVQFSRDIVKHLKELEAVVKYTEYQGVNHNSWESAYADSELYKWLFRQSR